MGNRASTAKPRRLAVSGLLLCAFIASGLAGCERAPEPTKLGVFVVSGHELTELTTYGPEVRGNCGDRPGIAPTCNSLTLAGANSF
jgi:hypothetical protein